jgi:hypothetical protein
MSHEAAACYRCGADLTARALRGRPVPDEQSLSPSKEGGKTYRVVCAVCGTVNLVKLAAGDRGTK